MKARTEAKPGQLGIFWLVPEDETVVLLAHNVSLSAAETYGDCLTCPLSHYHAWEATKRGKPVLGPLTPAAKRLIAMSEYEDWPRGRVVYDRAAGSFIIYADRQIFPHAAIVRAHFHLPKTAPLQADPHYLRARRLAEKPYFHDHGIKQ